MTLPSEFVPPGMRRAAREEAAAREPWRPGQIDPDDVDHIAELAVDPELQLRSAFAKLAEIVLELKDPEQRAAGVTALAFVQGHALGASG